MPPGNPPVTPGVAADAVEDHPGASGVADPRSGADDWDHQLWVLLRVPMHPLTSRCSCWMQLVAYLRHQAISALQVQEPADLQRLSLAGASSADAEGSDSACSIALRNVHRSPAAVMMRSGGLLLLAVLVCSCCGRPACAARQMAQGAFVTSLCCLRHYWLHQTWYSSRFVNLIICFGG